MTIEQWLEWAVADAEHRNLPHLKPLLETFARSLQALRDADFNDSALRLPPPALRYGGPRRSEAKAGNRTPRSG